MLRTVTLRTPLDTFEYSRALSQIESRRKARSYFCLGRCLRHPGSGLQALYLHPTKNENSGPVVIETVSDCDLNAACKCTPCVAFSDVMKLAAQTFAWLITFSMGASVYAMFSAMVGKIPLHVALWPWIPSILAITDLALL